MNTPPVTSSQQFRRALGAFATGVTIVTTRDGAGQDIGLTANSFNSVSLNPPMVLWSLSRHSLSLPAFMAAEHFAVHVLAANQDDLAQRFATRGADKFGALAVERGPGDIPLLEGCAARFQCRTAYRYEGGDHVIFVGAVVAFDQSERAPLVFHAGEYAIAARKQGMAAIADPPPETDSSFSSGFLIYLLGRAHYQLFLRLRRELDQHGLAEADWFVLSILSTDEQQSIAQLDARLAYTGTQVTYDQIALLASAGFVKLHGAYYPGVPVSLTDAGRQAVIELVAAAKAAESDAERHLGYDETRLLKQWLRQIIDDSDPGPPASWRRHGD
jgi:3-hydroxy-9,10-secoandrosta-1,3,5(10)-triene-9,17-dione monooxygenase reductase component